MNLAIEALDVASFEVAMVPANFINLAYIDGEFMAKARQLDMAVVGMKPFGGGRIENARLCIKSLKEYPGVIPCTGIEKTREMEENIGAWEENSPLTEQNLAEIKKIRNELGVNFCRQCAYCMPCPEGIPIIFMNMIKVFFRQMPENIFVNGYKDTVEKAANCTECGRCVEKCPYDLPIPEMHREGIAFYKGCL